MVRYTQTVTGLALTGGVILALFYPPLMLSVVTVSYSGLTQTFVGILLACTWKGATKWGIGAGLAAGVSYLFLAGAVPYGLNMGFVALIINFTVAIVVSLLTKTDREAIARFDAYKNLSR